MKYVQVSMHWARLSAASRKMKEMDPDTLHTTLDLSKSLYRFELAQTA
jgi:hypothetical protein